MENKSTQAIRADPNVIPDRSGCLRLMTRMAMAPHIAAHSLRVWQVACAIAPGLTAAGRPLNLKLVEAGAMLHDITKTRSLTTGENHAASGEALLGKMGLAPVAALVGQHVALHSYPPETLNEAVIVNYADKRVIHDRVVSLGQRLTYILETYGSDAARRRRIRRLWLWTETLEAQIFKPLSFGPGQLSEHLDNHAFAESWGQFRQLSRLDL
jgi:hypothetical protein